MHPPHLRERAIALKAAGVGFSDICRELSVSRDTVSDWLYGRRARQRAECLSPAPRCPRCGPTPGIPDDPRSYAYLLGLYLGDGHLVTNTKVPVLRIFCADAWPGLIDLCEQAMRTVLAKNVQRARKQGCVGVQSSSRHWPCLLPQHGPGKKHDRLIQLTDWQQPIVDDFAGDFLRGLFHSDGCRSINRITKGEKTYLYPRYLFSNESADIMALCQKSLDRLDISWRMCRRNMLSVARADAVTALDTHVGPKF